MTDLRVMVVMPLGEQLGGGEVMFQQLMRHGRGQGIEWIAVFTKDGPMVAETRALGVETHLIEAGRIRANPVFGDRGLDFFLCGDQLLKGAALNAVQIAELISGDAE